MFYVDEFIPEQEPQTHGTHTWKEDETKSMLNLFQMFQEDVKHRKKKKKKRDVVLDSQKPG